MEAGPSSLARTRFQTQILPTDATHPVVTFQDASCSSLRPVEPFHEAQIAQCHPLTRESLTRAAEAIKASLPVAFPTETVYGLAANALCETACKSIFDAKGRPQDNPLIVHVSDLRMAKSVTQRGWTAPKVYESLIRRFWPGGITFLVPAARNGNDHHQQQQQNGKDSSDPTDTTEPFVGTGTSNLPLMVTADHPLVGIRMPSHPLARALIAHTQLPLAAPSANASGRPSPTTAQHVMYDLGGQLDTHLTGSQQQGRIPYILDGGASHSGVESTVVDGVTQPGELRILRPGAVSPEEIQQCMQECGDVDDGVVLRVYGRDIAREKTFEAAPTTPGMKYRHYSPTAPVVLLVAKQAGSGDESSWHKVILEHLEELRAAKGGAETLKIGIMLLVDSPLAKHVLQPHQSPKLTSWLASEQKTSEQAESATSDALGPLLSLSDNHATLQPFSLGSLRTPSLAARRLFAGLRILDQEPHAVDLIMIESVADTGIGLAVMNRVNKAAGQIVQVTI